MKKLLLAGIAATAFCGAPALAADMPLKAAPPAPMQIFNWTGFYAGVNAGYAWSVNDDLLSFNDVGTFAGVSPKGGFGGGQIGYNWQSGSPFVFGLETDIQGSNISDSGISSAGRGTRYNLDWFGSFRGRIGYAFDRSLVYATGGFAYGGLNKTTFAGVPTDFLFNGTATGYALGAGFEYSFSPAWSLKVEYQYINLGRNDMFDTTGVNYASTRNLNTSDDAFHTIRVGFNYRFGGWGMAPIVSKY